MESLKLESTSITISDGVKEPYRYETPRRPRNPQYISDIRTVEGCRSSFPGLMGQFQLVRGGPVVGTEAAIGAILVALADSLRFDSIQ